MRNILLLLFLTQWMVFNLAAQSDPKTSTINFPHENKENKLDLKIVFQKYIIASKNYYVESKYPLLKVNDKYLPNDNTGINQADFKRYLSNCPAAFTKAELGLKKYDDARKKARYGYYIGFGSVLIAGYFAIKSFGLNSTELNDKNDLYIAGAIGLGGIVTQQIIYHKAKKIDNEANKTIVDAFDTYNRLCFTPINTNTTPNDEATSETIKNTTKNGDFNTDEVVPITIINNDINKSFYGGGISINTLFQGAFDGGPSANQFYFKKGWGIYSKYTYLLNLIKLLDPEDAEFERNNFNVESIFSVPLNSKIKKKKNFVNLGKSQNIDFNGKIYINNLYAYGIDAGLKYRKNNLHKNFEFGSEYKGNLVELKIGPSFSRYAHLHYKVKTDRFNTEKTITSSLRFYAHGIYTISNTIFDFRNQIDQSNEYSKIGGVIGFWLAGIFKTRGLNFSLEGGLYPGIKSFNRYGGEISLGFILGGRS